MTAAALTTLARPSLRVETSKRDEPLPPPAGLVSAKLAATSVLPLQYPDADWNVLSESLHILTDRR